MSEINDNLTPQQIAAAEQRSANEKLIHRTLVAFDQFWNVATGGNLDETISARAERDARKHEVLAVVLSHALDLAQKDHGQKAEAGDLARAQKVAGIEGAALGVPVNQPATPTTGIPPETQK